jgi:hypothetical protein
MSHSLAPLQKEERETRSTALRRCFSQGQLASAIDLGAWLQNGAGDGPVSSNQPSQDLPFQRWFKFKEAFSPHLVVDLIRSLPYRATSCLDPFGGSGTTALACQFLGISPITIEVNPLLADVIEAKLHSYDPSAVMRDIRSIRTAAANTSSGVRGLAEGCPQTLCEPGRNGRWIFSKDLFRHIASYRGVISGLSSSAHRRLFSVLLASVLVEISNVVVNGKGRRYRAGWRRRQKGPIDLDDAFERACQAVVFDIVRYQSRACSQYTLLRGDSRKLLPQVREADLVLFSPPYPNSFDYTDIYNVELWTMGYLSSSQGNRHLREHTLRSHVQIRRAYDEAPESSKTLRQTLRSLCRQEGKLWNLDIPGMVGSYFADLSDILQQCAKLITRRGQLACVVGDSRYANVLIPVATVLSELAPSLGLRVIEAVPIRAMRSSAQQGGRDNLGEVLLRLARQ